MRFAVIIHPRHIDQVHSAYPVLKRLPVGLVARVLPYLPPVKTGEVLMREGSSGDIITCPLLPSHFQYLTQKFLTQKIASCIRKAEKQGAQIVGLEGLTASFLDEGQVQINTIKATLTTGLRLRTHALLENARLVAKRLGIQLAQAEVVLVGAYGQEGETWTNLLARESRTLTLLQTEAGRELEFASKIIYETGLALKVTANSQTALAKADVVFFHHLNLGASLEGAWFKPGSLVCSIIPGMGCGDLLRSRKDVVYLEDLVLEVPSEIAWSGNLDFSAGVSVTVAEIIIMVLEKDSELFCPRREITIKQVQNMTSMARKYGFRVGSGAKNAATESDLGLGSSIAKP